jgi:signal transduction histidine kinase
MRAPVQKKRPRGNGGVHNGTPMRRGKRVRTRLVAGVVVTGIVVMAAGTPALLEASARLDDAQQLLTLARLDRQAVSLSHSLADERDQVVVFVAAGRSAKATKDGGDTGGTDDTRGKGGDDDSLRTAGDMVDRQITEVRAVLAGSSVPAAFSGPLKDLGTVASVRHTAVTGKGSAIAAYTAYTQVITSLERLTEALGDRAPADTAPGVRAQAALDRAASQASATRGLLLAALTVPVHEATINPLTGLPIEGSSSDSAEGRERDALSAAAQLAHVREQAALDDFDTTATAAERRSFADTVTGADVKSAEDFLGKLTATPQLSGSDLDTDPAKLNTALTARIDQMRGAESGLGADGLKGFGKVRDDAVRDLELRAALAAGCLVVAVAVSAAVARTLTRPLAAVRIGTARLAAEPATAEPVRFTGRNDEFAEVVRSVNALHATVLALTAKAAGAAGPAAATATTTGSGTATLSAGVAAAPGAVGVPARDLADGEGALAGAAQGLRGAQDAASVEAETEARVRAAEAAAVSALTARERAAFQEQIAEVTGHLREARHSIRHTFANLSLRNLGLVERQLGVIESLEEREQDPERLATLYKLDHMATVMRRHSENLLVLAEHEQSHAHAGPVPLVDVLRAAVSEIERYERITIQTLPPHAQVAGYAADDLSHLVAELLENAATFSPPDAAVELSGWLLETGEVMLSVVDQGIGATDDGLAALNARLAGTSPGTSSADDHAPGHAFDEHSTGQTYAQEHGVPPAQGLGLRVVALLAARHGVRVELRRQQQDGGLTAVVLLPQQLLPSAPPAFSDVSPVPAGASGTSLPGSVAEVNSHVLPVRPGAPAPHDPLIAAAEASVRAAELAGTITPGPAAGAGAAPTAPAAPATEAGSAEPGTPSATGDAGPAEPPGPTGPTGPASAASDTTGSASTAVPGGAGGHPRVPGARTPEPRRHRPAQDPYAIGPDSHERAAAGDGTGGLDQDTFTMRLPGQTGTVGRELPKRVPKPVRTAGAPVVRKRGVDPEELRRRLGGFHQGAKAGRQDAEEEIRQVVQQDQRQPHAPRPHVQQPGGERPHGQQEHASRQDRTAQQYTEAAGETVEEARS